MADIATYINSDGYFDLCQILKIIQLFLSNNDKQVKLLQ